MKDTYGYTNPLPETPKILLLEPVSDPRSVLCDRACSQGDVSSWQFTFWFFCRQSFAYHGRFSEGLPPFFPWPSSATPATACGYAPVCHFLIAMCKLAYHPPHW